LIRFQGIFGADYSTQKRCNLCHIQARTLPVKAISWFQSWEVAAHDFQRVFHTLNHPTQTAVTSDLNNEKRADNTHVVLESSDSLIEVGVPSSGVMLAKRAAQTSRVRPPVLRTVSSRRT
jgi:hypothetical protein